MRAFPNINFRKKARSNSINSFPIEQNKPDRLVFDSALLYLSNSNGLAGELVVDSERLVFKSGFHNLKQNPKLIKHNFFDEKPKTTYQESLDGREIDMKNIAEINNETVNERGIVYIFCKNFKHAKIELKRLWADALYKKLINNHREIVESTKTLQLCFLWEYLYDTYQYRLRSDWVKFEKWYVNNFKIQFTQFNETNICPTIPEIVIVPRNVDDKELEAIVNISDGQRVPIITYLHRSSGHMIIRSTTYNQNRLNLYELYKARIFDDKIKLIEYEVENLLPSIENLEKYHFKLRKGCNKAVRINLNKDIKINYDINHCKQFWSKCSNWMCTMAKVLKLTFELVDTILEKASIGLVERNDCNWNCLLSSLVQIIINPEKRTLNGFECLLSKEFIYLCGYKYYGQGFYEKRIKSLNEPNHILFLFFLDAVHQLMMQNPDSFEFTTFYLVFLFDNQLSSQRFNSRSNGKFETNRKHLLHLNPFYVKTNNDILQMKTHVVHLKLFTQLYFRSLESNVNIFTSREILYIEELHRRKAL